MVDTIRLDATALRVLAHPLRSRLLSQLRLHGEATATELADRLGTNTGATSYHLRKLEEVGLVNDTGTGAGKRRVWEAATRGHEWEPSDFAGDEEAEASVSWLTRHYTAELVERAELFFQAEAGWPAAWRDALGYGDDGLLLTPEQAREMREEIQAVLHRFRDAGAGDPQAVRVIHGSLLVPVEATYQAPQR
ncbi:ArsR/SmtB family transcription factor [Nocardioides coralli]|uniref:ArsR/SmtB family transcription factor n=1 Tax=Nocardioides coralli TaxID=2872154 RepID=UPI001CA3C472|nr:helix-turn-helix domain-containing protein [Nocardioides coralli]QZY28279.1 helix-turn-helix domain-containing protein [Nocardioides coralli]